MKTIIGRRTETWMVPVVWEVKLTDEEFEQAKKACQQECEEDIDDEDVYVYVLEQLRQGEAFNYRAKLSAAMLGEADHENDKVMIYTMIGDAWSEGEDEPGEWNSVELEDE